MMVEELTMAKNNPADMNHTERMSWLAGDLHSASGVAKADKVLELIKHEWLDVLAIRDMAVDAVEILVSPCLHRRLYPSPEQSGEAHTAQLTWATLIQRYRTDEGSPFLHIRFATRENYDGLMKRISAEYGDNNLAEVKASDLGAMYERWSEGGKVGHVHALIGMVRTLVNFGSTVLKNEQCDRLAVPLHRMRA